MIRELLAMLVLFGLLAFMVGTSVIVCVIKATKEEKK